MNKQFKPAVTTGGYGDRSFNDEWFWAASELWTTTGEAAYFTVVTKEFNNDLSLPSWANVRMLGHYTLLKSGKRGPAAQSIDVDAQKEKFLRFADAYLPAVEQSAFHTVMGRSKTDFVWGSSSVAANQGIVLIHAYRLTRNKKYLEAALTNLDYLLGRNATGYCLVTGIGTYATMHPHHRPSVADGITEPVPGLLSGGPNPGKQDRCTYAFSEPETTYSDTDCSYASNEIAINWNAPAVYLAAAIEALAVSF